MKKMKKKQLDPYSLSDIFRDIELKLITSMRNNLSRHEKWEEELGYQWEQWQISKLRAISKFRLENHKIIAPYIEPIQDVIDQVLRQSYGKAYNDSIKLMDEIGLSIAGMDNSSVLGGLEIPEENFFQINEDKLLSIIGEMQMDFKHSEGLILRKMDDAYRSILSKSVIEMGTGATSIQKAIDEASKEFLSKGIDCITYKDGKRVNIASYAEMYLRTASQKATFVAQGKARDRMKVYTVLSSQHANCCEHCLKWQAIVMIDDVYTSISSSDAKEMSQETKYPLLSDAMKDQFLHPNCRHSLTTWFPGSSTTPTPFTEAQSERALKRYNLEQEQRSLENSLRRWKRIKEGSIDVDLIKRASYFVNYYQNQLREHIKSNPGLRREYWRERSI